MGYCGANLNGWFDDLVSAGTQIATTAIRQSTPVGYGTTTPPMFPPPTYGAPPTAQANIGAGLQQLLPYVLIAGVVWFIVKGRK
jgi:hypothetical protein